MRLKRALSFDDVMLTPRYSDLFSRAEADLSTNVASVPLKIPIIAANMSSVCEDEMAIALGELGGLGIIHRMCSIEDQAKMVNKAARKSFCVGFSIGIGEDWHDRIDACRNNGGQIAVLDIAHSHHKRVIELLPNYFGVYKNFPLIIGQVSTASAVRDLLQVIPENYYKFIAFKCGIGGGSLCTTRIKTGFGIPTLQSIIDITTEFPHISLIADGGIRESGDIVKSLAGGADAVMIGHLLAGTDEAPGRTIKGKDGQIYKEYMGSASLSAKTLRGEIKNIEGDSTLVPYKGPVDRIIADLLDGIRSGFSYGAAHNINELQDDIEFIEITAAGYRESLPHGLL